jgi:hypothetical protein
MADENVVATVEDQGGALAVYDFGSDAGRGFEDQTSEEFQLPFIALLQDLSPQVTGEDGKGIEGAKAGMFLNTVTNDLIEKSFEFTPSHKERAFVEWKPRTAGGGFVSRFLPDDPIVAKARSESKEFGQYRTPAGNNLVDTIYLFGIVDKGDGNLQQACLVFTSTKMKIYKKWNTVVNAFSVVLADGTRQQPPRYAHLLRISSKRDKSPKGSFYNVVVEPAQGGIKDSLLRPNDPRYLAARSLADLVKKGVAKVSEAVETDNDADGPF